MYDVLRMVEKEWLGLTTLSTVLVFSDFSRYEPIGTMSRLPTARFRFPDPMLSARIGLAPLAR